MDGMRGGKGAVRKIDLDAFFQPAKDVAPFLFPGFGLIGPQHFPEIPPFHLVMLSSHFFRPCVGVLWVHRWEPQRILTLAGRLAKNRAPFHATQGLLHPPGFGVDPMRRVHPGIARHGRLAKDRAPHLIR